jgi:hypothetical protein
MNPILVVKGIVILGQIELGLRVPGSGEPRKENYT